MTDQQITLDPREDGGSYWLRGARDRYGEAYFFAPISGRDDAMMLWRNGRPYTVNHPVAPVTFPPTWEQIDEAIRNEAVDG